MKIFEMHRLLLGTRRIIHFDVLHCHFQSVYQHVLHPHVEKNNTLLKPRSYLLSRACLLSQKVKSTGGSPLNKNISGGFMGKNSKLILLDAEGKDKGVVSKRKAEEMAAEAELKLVLIDKTSGSHLIYQMMTNKQLIETQKQLREAKRGERKKEVKTLRIQNKISEHDLETKMGTVKQWLVKGHDVKVTLKQKKQECDLGASSVFRSITDAVKDIAQVHHAKKTDMEFVLELKAMDTSYSANPKQTSAPLKHTDLKSGKVKTEP